MTAGRKRAQPPALAYDVHRAITLVQVLASEHPDSGILGLCEAWGVSVYASTDPITLDPIYDKYATIRALARHALEYSRRQPEDKQE